VSLPEKRPNCYRRLKVFGDFGKELGDRLFSIDLDTVIMRNITHIVDRKEDFVIWKDPSTRTHYNGGLWLMTSGTRKQVWDSFTPDAPEITKGMVGSDQAFISHVLGPSEATWDTQDGVYSYRAHLRNGALPPPKNACIISMHGAKDPWTVNDKRIKEHYR
jgi:hypothetical protein